MSESAWPSHAGPSSFYRPELMIGAASPLWGYFTGAAAIGVAYWWSARLMREGFVNLLQAATPAAEAVSGNVVRLQAAPQAAIEALDAAAADLVDKARQEVEAIVEPAWDAAVEMVAGPLAEALSSEEEPAIPVGGESAPIAPAALEAAPAAEPAPAPEPAPAAELKFDEPAPAKAEEEEPAPASPTTPRSRKPRTEGQPKPH